MPAPRVRPERVGVPEGQGDVLVGGKGFAGGRRTRGGGGPGPFSGGVDPAAIAECDAADGLKDGVIEDPTRCAFDPKTIECKGADELTCLTSKQVETARKIYSGPGPGIAPG